MCNKQSSMTSWYILERTYYQSVRIYILILRKIWQKWSHPGVDLKVQHKLWMEVTIMSSQQVSSQVQGSWASKCLQKCCHNMIYSFSNNNGMQIICHGSDRFDFKYMRQINNRESNKLSLLSWILCIGLGWRASKIYSTFKATYSKYI